MNRAAEDNLPPELLVGATLSGNEYGWTLTSFPDALRKAEAHGLACLGGQLQFRLPDGIYEMYWLESNSAERRSGESWPDYSHRSCAEVWEEFDRLIKNTDFYVQASNWPSLKSRITHGVDLLSTLVFVAYFVTESELGSLRSSG